MITHDPQKAINQLNIILSNPGKKIGFLFGAGISLEDKERVDLIPGVSDIILADGKLSKKGLTSIILDFFTQEPQKTALKQIIDDLDGSKNNIESILSSISEKEKAAGREKLCGLDKDELKKLREEIENKIKDIVSVHKDKKFGSRKLYHYDLARWIKNADRHSEVEIFTTNYDYLLESSLEKYQVPYFDGFIGSRQAFFYPEWIEDDSGIKKWTKLWKLHGSLGWAVDEENKEIVRNPDDDSKNNAGMIYPSFLKYDRSRKQPYLSYMDRLSFFLRQEDAVLIICGYSFGDQHINDLLISSLSQSRSAHAFILKFGNLVEDNFISQEIAKKVSKISLYAKDSAVIGCQYGIWELSSKSENVFGVKIIESGSAKKVEFLLGDFGILTSFLSESMNGNNNLSQEHA